MKFYLIIPPDCSQIFTEYGHMKNRCSRVSPGSLQKEHPKCTLLLHCAIRSPADSLFFCCKPSDKRVFWGGIGELYAFVGDPRGLLCLQQFQSHFRTETVFKFVISAFPLLNILRPNRPLSSYHGYFLFKLYHKHVSVSSPSFLVHCFTEGDVIWNSKINTTSCSENIK